MGIGETLQTKAGPLPVWAWGVGGGVGLALLLRMRGAGGANPVGPLVLQPASAGGGLSVNSPTAQGTGGADLGAALADRTVVRDPTTHSVTQLWDTTDAGSVVGRYYNPNFPMFGRENRYGAGLDSQAQADALGGAAAAPAPSPGQAALASFIPLFRQSATPTAQRPVYDPRAPEGDFTSGFSQALTTPIPLVVQFADGYRHSSRWLQSGIPRYFTAYTGDPSSWRSQVFGGESPQARLWRYASDEQGYGMTAPEAWQHAYARVYRMLQETGASSVELSQLAASIPPQYTGGA